MMQMKSRAVVMAALAMLAMVTLAFEAQAYDSASAGDAAIREQFDAFLVRYGKHYAAASDEYEHRLGIFTHNLAKIAARNAKYAGKTQHGITQFADMTQEEFQNRVLMRPPPLPTEKRVRGPTYAGLKAPTSFDWRNKTGVVTPVYNQGQCGSCWAFSATENIESQWALTGNKLTELAMQQIVDCDSTDSGCGGGWPYNAYEYVMSAPGMEPLADYPYTAADGSCAYNSGEVVAKISDWTYTTTDQDEHQMANYLAQHGPISVCVDASQWSLYTGGVYTADACTTSIDHCVLAVGYNLAANPPYWIIRNSWGADWGLQGYMYLEFGQDACAVAQVSTSSIV